MTRLTDMDGYPIYLPKPQSDTGIAFALIGVVLALLIMGSVLAACWPQITAWLARLQEPDDDQFGGSPP